MRRLYSLLVAVLFLSACAPNALRPKTVSLCRGERCETVSDAAARERLLVAFHDLLRKSKGGQALFFASSPKDNAERSEGIRFFTQGGPIPGISTFLSMEIRSVLFLDKEKGESKAVVHTNARYVGVPLLCSEGDLLVGVSGDEARVTFSNVCTWLGIGTTLTKFEWMLDKVDVDRGLASGHWAAKTAGLPVLGGGHGYMVALFQPPAAAAPAAQPVAAVKPASKPAVQAPQVEEVSDAIEMDLKVKLEDENGDLVLESNESVSLEAAISNKGTKAEKAALRLTGEPVLVRCLGAQKDVPSVAPGATATLTLACRLPQDVPAQTVSLRVDLSAGDKNVPAAARILKIGMRPTMQAVEQVVSETGVDDIPPGSKSGHNANVALVIGLSRYREKSIPGVKYASRDAEVMARYLERVAGVSPENLKLLTDDSATKSDLEAYIQDWLPRHTTPDSTVFIYYAGHGTRDDLGKEAFLVPFEGQPDFPSKLFSLGAMYSTLATLPAKSVVVMLDSCFSGAGDRGISRSGTRPLVSKLDDTPPQDPRIAVLAGASGTQLTSDLDAAEHGLFTYYLLKGLRGEADADHDGTITLSELYAFVRAGVSEKASRALNRDQTPVLLGSEKSGDVPVARR